VRLQGAFATVLVMAAVVLAVGVRPWIAESAEAPATSGSVSTALAVPAVPPGAFALTVLYVYDGDTIQAQIQAPNEIVTTSDPIRVRLIGVDTPEGTPTPECWADDARRHLGAMLPEGSTVWAAPDRDTEDDYGRRLFELWTDDGRFVASELVSAGDAEAIRIRPNVTHHELLAQLETEARAAGRGRWGACG